MDASPDAFRTPPAHAGRIIRPGAARATSRGNSPEDALPARVALCLHRMDPGALDEPSQAISPHSPGDHVDLFIGATADAEGADNAPNDNARVAHSWRLPVTARDWRTALQATGAVRWPATPTPAHRALYLRLTQPRTLDGGRGTVEPLDAGDGWMRYWAGSLVAEVRLATVENDGAAKLVRVEVREDAEGTTAEFRLLEPHEGTMHDGS